MRYCWCLRSRAGWGKVLGGGFEIYGAPGVSSFAVFAFACFLSSLFSSLLLPSFSFERGLRGRANGTAELRLAGQPRAAVPT